MSQFSTIADVTKAVDDGRKVHWSNGQYEVICDMLGQYLVVYRPWSKNPNYVGLFWQDGVTSDYDPADFFFGDYGQSYDD